MRRWTAYRSRRSRRHRSWTRSRSGGEQRTAPCVLALRRTEEGRLLLLAGRELARNGRRGGLRLAQVGLLVVALGVGACSGSARIATTKEVYDRYRKENLATWGTLFLCAGIALTGS